MKLVVGLGNPGKEYNNTRHNIGFNFIDYYAEKHGIEIKRKKFNGLYVETLINNKKVIFLKPQSFINLSGEVVKKYVDFYKISIDDILIINDDLDLPVGKYKLKSNGSSGGHNGLKNIEFHLHTQNYKRLKIGISNNKNIDTKDYVLGNFFSDEVETINDLKEVVNNIIDDFFKLGFDDLMTKYNHK